MFEDAEIGDRYLHDTYLHLHEETFRSKRLVFASRWSLEAMGIVCCERIQHRS